MKKLWVGYPLMMLSTKIILCISPFENSQLVLSALLPETIAQRAQAESREEDEA